MNITYRCPQCDRSVRVELSGGVVVCPACRAQIEPPPSAWRDGELERCLVCPSGELYVRKDFPQRWGLAIIVVGFLLSSVAWAYHRSLLSLGILIATALLDALLYWLVGDVVACYRCHAEYRGVAGRGRIRPFDLAVHERFRRQAARQTLSAKQ
ncbi:MAG: hypothetical protein KatS3mg110_0059 [Pirellulaceae bacterium]|nr:MAG: hypothetical protein KatS3mg110_0059 [Pirellulaceae bacterium]